MDLDLKYRWRHFTEGLLMDIAWLLPSRLVYFAVIRVWAHATCKIHTNLQPDEVTWSLALDAWEKTYAKH